MPSDNITILVRMPNWLGDCVMALPALRRLGESLPRANIHLAGRAAFRDLLLAQPGVAGFVEAPASGFGPLLKGMSDTRRIVRDAGMPDGVDMGVLFTNSLSTAAWLWRTGAAARIGYDLDCRRFFLTHPVPCGGIERSLHFIQYYMRLATFAESLANGTAAVSRREAGPSRDLPIPGLEVGAGGMAEAGALLARSGIGGSYAVIAPASAYGPVKDWPAAHYRRLVEGLNREFSLPVLVTGGKAQAAACLEIARDQRSAVSVAGETSLAGFAGLLAGAALFAGGDSGGAHVAAALGVPTLVIFGITNPSRTRPTGIRVRALGGGGDRDVRLSTPAAREAARRALEAIGPEQVLEAAREALRGSSPTGSWDECAEENIRARPTNRSAF